MQRFFIVNRNYFNSITTAVHTSTVFCAISTENMYSEYSALDCHLLRMQKTTSMTSDWLRVLPSSRSTQLTGDCRSSIRELQKWRPTAGVMEMAQRQPLNLSIIGDDNFNSSPYGSPRWRRQQSNDDGHHGATDLLTDERCAIKRRTTVANGRRRFDFTRLAESATRRDDSPAYASDTEITAGHSVDRGLKFIKHDEDQSDRRLPLKPAAAAEDPDNRSLICSTIPQPLKSVFNPIESFDRYTSVTLFDDKIRPRRCNEPIELGSPTGCMSMSTSVLLSRQQEINVIYFFMI